ncbi:MAG: 50S ribosomal protein L37e [Candidatus Aenigmarchaeota archaeon]|nr:50S ribosomal protein L37e [Candidatus Aenigmarchaeota archaeon]MCK5333863.1 50S ribosomal protein L37e [Candidatus Aenigmarchaeota archaeon]
MPTRNGKPSFGKRNKKVHELCRRCGKHSYHIKDKICSACGFGKTAKIRAYSWQSKSGVTSKTRKL